MLKTWKEQLDSRPELRDLANWPYIDQRALPLDRRKLFMRNKRLVARVLSYDSISTVAADANVSRGTLYSLLKRTLESPDGDQPALTVGLVPFAQVTKPKRKMALSSLSCPSAGRCSLSYVLDKLPDVTKKLDEHLSAFIKRSASGQNLKPGVFHRLFISLLKEYGWPTDTYPFTESSLGYESVRKYFHSRIDALKQLNGSSKQTVPRPLRPLSVLEEVELDEQLTDGAAAFEFEINGIKVTERLARLSLVMMVDVASDCWLSYHLAFTRSPRQEDVLAVFDQFYKPWKQLKCSESGLRYTVGAMMPSGLGKDFANLPIKMVKLDNALCHMAESIQHYVCEQLGATINLGIPGQPKSRNVIEHAFRLVSDQLKRYPSTTGASPLDPERETPKNRKSPPIVTLGALEEAISVIVANHNALPQAALGNKAPIDVFKEGVLHGLVIRTSDDVATLTNPFLRRKKATIRKPKLESRLPYINFKYARYQGTSIASDSMINQEVFVEYDSTDLRTIKAYRPDGTFLGELMANGGWGKHKHSRGMREHIYRENRKLRRASQDPLGDYFRAQLEEARSPKKALEAVRILREAESFQLDNDLISEAGPRSKSQRRIKPRTTDVNACAEIKPWSVGTASRAQGSQDEHTS